MDRRWWILVCCCVTHFVTDFFYDEPSILAQRLTGTAEACSEGNDSCLNLSLYQFNLIFAVYSWATAVAAILAGFAIDKYGCKMALLVSAGCLFFGSLCFLIGCYLTNQSTVAFAMIMVARILYGLGAGGTIVITHKIKAAWFLYKELALAFSIHILLGRLGSATCFLLIGGLIDDLGLKGSFWVGFVFTLLASVACIILAFLNERGPAILYSSPTGGNFSMCWTFLLSVDGIYWSYGVIVFLFYGCVSVFVSNGPNFVATRYNYPETAASYIVGVVYDVGLIAPVGGWLMDKYGFREHWLTATSFLLFLAFLGVLTIGNFPAVLLTLTIGLGYTFFAPTVWSSIPLIIRPDSVGMGIGLLKFLQNFGSGTMSAVAGVILDLSPDNRISPWQAFLIFLAVSAAVCLVTTGVIELLNSRSGRRLSPSQAERNERNDILEITPLRNSFKQNADGGSIKNEEPEQ